VDWIALDPVTANDEKASSFETTALHQAMIKGPLRDIIATVIGPSRSWTMARARVVFADPVDSGALRIHQERNFVTQTGVHNIWTAFAEPGVITNRSASGIQFFVGHRGELVAENDRAVALLDDIKQAAKNGSDTFGGGFFYRPELSNGDIVMFDSAMPHGSFLPAKAARARVSFDIRIFPNLNAGTREPSTP
jgi:hypothetical protein